MRRTLDNRRRMIQRCVRVFIYSGRNRDRREEKTIRYLYVFLLILSLSAFGRSAAAQQASINPHGEIELGLECNSCHSTEVWSPLKDEMSFYHDMQTGFPLTGSHTTVACASCHVDLKFSELHASPTECATCHVDVHQGALTGACIDCHNTSSFRQIEGISLHLKTSFPLVSMHEQISCISCHTDEANGAFTPLDTRCISCHEADMVEAKLVDHVAAGFQKECETCHNDLQWQGADFYNHDLHFPIYSGVHDGKWDNGCLSCHLQHNYPSYFSCEGSCHVHPQSLMDPAHSGLPKYVYDFSLCIACHDGVGGIREL